MLAMTSNRRRRSTELHRRRLRAIWRSAGWPSQDLVEVELLAAGWVERLRDGHGRETLRVTDAGVAVLAATLARNRGDARRARGADRPRGRRHAARRAHRVARAVAARAHRRRRARHRPVDGRPARPLLGAQHERRGLPRARRPRDQGAPRRPARRPAQAGQGRGLPPDGARVLVRAGRGRRQRGRRARRLRRHGRARRRAGRAAPGAAARAAAAVRHLDGAGAGDAGALAGVDAAGAGRPGRRAAADPPRESGRRPQRPCARDAWACARPRGRSRGQYGVRAAPARAPHAAHRRARRAPRPHFRIPGACPDDPPAADFRPHPEAVRPGPRARRALAGFGPAAHAVDGPPSTNVAWQDATSDADIDKAFAAAKAQNKPVLLYWGAVWCPPCNQLKATLFNRQDFGEQSKSLVAVHLDGDAPGAQKLGTKFKVVGLSDADPVQPRPQGADAPAGRGRRRAGDAAAAAGHGQRPPDRDRCWPTRAPASRCPAASGACSRSTRGTPTRARRPCRPPSAARCCASWRPTCPASESAACTRLALKSIADSDEKNAPAPDAATRARVAQVLADPALSRTYMDVLTNSAHRHRHRAGAQAGPGAPEARRVVRRRAGAPAGRRDAVARRPPGRAVRARRPGPPRPAQGRRCIRSCRRRSSRRCATPPPPPTARPPTRSSARP